jgi:hypothetical protein
MTFLMSSTQKLNFKVKKITQKDLSTKKKLSIRNAVLFLYCLSIMASWSLFPLNLTQLNMATMFSIKIRWYRYRVKRLIGISDSIIATII